MQTSPDRVSQVKGDMCRGSFASRLNAFSLRGVAVSRASLQFPHESGHHVPGAELNQTSSQRRSDAAVSHIIVPYQARPASGEDQKVPSGRLGNWSNL